MEETQGTLGGKMKEYQKPRENLPYITPVSIQARLAPLGADRVTLHKGN